MNSEIKRKPPWLRIRNTDPGISFATRKLLNKNGLNTVCDEAMCPNRGECFGKQRAAFMLLGSICTRDCAFCAVEHGVPLAPDPQEPGKIAVAVKELSMSHVVLTSVTRDDLPDGGAEHFTQTITQIRKTSPKTAIEVLIPDFQGDSAALATIIAAKPDIINHNLETVPDLYQEIRPEAIYKRSLDLLANVKTLDSNIYTKSGIMVGLGETNMQVIALMDDLRAVNCDFLTVGQYLQPSKHHHPVIEYIHPDIFDQYKQTALEKGFSYVASAPFVRSSYNAEESLSE